MRHSFRTAAAAALTFGLTVAFAVSAHAQAKPEGWSLVGNLGGSLTAGNSQTTNGTGKLRIERNWLRSVFFIDGGGVWATALQPLENGRPEQYAIGPASAIGRDCSGSCSVTTNRETQRTAESYSVEAAFERRITEAFLYQLGTGFLRDTFSGVDRKNDVRAGVGYLFRGTDSGELKLLALATYTDQHETVPDPEAEDSFFGVRFEANYAVNFGSAKQSQFASKLAVDENLQLTDDVRVTWDNALTVNMTDRLALQLGAKFAYRNRPALEEIPLFLPPGPSAPNAQAIGDTTTPLDKLDSQVSAALVITWSPRPPSQARPTP